MTDQRLNASAQQRFEDDRFEIGGEDLLEANRAPSSVQKTPSDDNDWVQSDAMKDIRIRIGTLLKAESVSFLLGAGASVENGGLTIGSVPLSVERMLHEQGISGDARPRIRRWLKVFYCALQSAGSGDGGPRTRADILERREQIKSEDTPVTLRINFEKVLSTLHCWRAAMSGNAERLRVEGYY